MWLPGFGRSVKQRLDGLPETVISSAQRAVSRAKYKVPSAQYRPAPKESGF
jgi:hypothetical protein